MAGGEHCVQLGERVGAASRRRAPHGLAPAEHEAHRAMLHFVDVRGKPLGTHDVLTQQFTHLGGGSAVMSLEPAAASTVFPVRLTMPRFFFFKQKTAYEI